MVSAPSSTIGAATEETDEEMKPLQAAGQLAPLQISRRKEFSVCGIATMCTRLCMVALLMLLLLNQRIEMQYLRNLRGGGKGHAEGVEELKQAQQVSKTASQQAAQLMSTHRPRVSHFFQLAKYSGQQKGEMLKAYGNPAVLEVGAHEGEEWSDLLKYADHLWAVEPSPDKKARLTHKAAEAGSKVTFFPMALALTNGKAKFWVDGPNSQQNTINKPPPWVSRQSFDAKAVDVDVHTLDYFWENVLGKAHITMLKVDTQGHDPEVIMGGEKLLTEDPPDIIHTEFSPGLMRAANISGTAFLTFLYKFGYICFDCQAFNPPAPVPSTRDISTYETHFGRFNFKGANHGQWADLICLK